VLEEVRAKRFVVVDEDASREVAVMEGGDELDKCFPHLVFYDKSGRQRLMIGAGSMTGPHIRLAGVNKPSGVSLMVLPKKGALIAIGDNEDCGAILEAHNKTVALKFVHENLERRAVLGIAEGAPALTMHYGGRTLLTVKPDFSPLLRLFDKDGEVVFEAPTPK
jgi:hypothetical protein